MNMQVFFTTAIADNGWIESLANTCFKPVRGVLQCVGGDSWNVRQFKVDLSKGSTEELIQPKSSEHIVYKIAKYILSFVFAIPGLIVGSLLKGLAQLDTVVAAKNKHVAAYLGQQKVIHHHLIDIFDGIQNILSLPEIVPEHDLNEISPSDLGHHAIVKAKFNDVSAILVRFIRRLDPQEPIGLSRNAIFHKDNATLESVLILSLKIGSTMPYVQELDSTSPALTGLSTPLEINWLKKLVKGQPCGKITISGGLEPEEGPTHNVDNKPYFKLWSPANT